MKKYFIILLFLAVVISFYSLTGCAEKGHHAATQDEEEKAESPKLSGKVEDGIRVIKVTASRYKFDPDPIVAKLGEKVRLIATSTDITHGLAIPEFKVNLTIPAGKTESAEFIADKKGTFHAHCSVYCGP